MSCPLSSHLWETVDMDVERHRTVFYECCLACRATRRVTVWLDGQVEYTYNTGAEA